MDSSPEQWDSAGVISSPGPSSGLWAQGPMAEVLAASQFLETCGSGVTWNTLQAARPLLLTWAMQIAPMKRSQLIRSAPGAAGGGHTARACLPSLGQ